jgi:hypothetical protein
MNHNGQHWQSFESGATLGMPGRNGGTIVRDEEHPDGARLTLERDIELVPYAITASVYGFGDHIRFIADEPTAQHAFDEMRPALSEILSLVPLEDDPHYGEKYDAVNDAFAAFADRFQ